MIGDSIEVTIVDIKGDKVRIGITAPKSVSVHRKEVYLAIQQENRAAAAAADMSALTDVGHLFGTQPAIPTPSPSHGHTPPTHGAGDNKSDDKANKQRGKKKS